MFMSKVTPEINAATHVVAIGASAGGIEALERLFNSLPTDLGCAYVVIQHLSPDFKSMMDELLMKNTKMPVLKAEEGQVVEPDHVYLNQAGKFMRINDGRIYLSDFPPDMRVNLPISEFFRTLAEDYQNRAVGIVLSGTGSDGCRGIQALKEVCALVIAQDPEEAQFDSMPQNAINTGAVDLVLSVSDMPKYIRNFITHPLSKGLGEDGTDMAAGGDTMSKILNLIEERTQLDFKAYKESTVSRRIEHRMSINKKLSLQEYWEYLVANENEVDLVKQDLLIGVTQFFRDREVWDSFREEVAKPIILNSTVNEPIRVWCAGCSTGEESYTIAMVFDQLLKEMKLDRQLKVFASDIDQSAINFSANGTYPASIANDIPAEYLNAYFDTDSDIGYRVSKELRSLVVFATHNLIQDPPFSNMDLVSCRNTLIYLQTPAQQKVLAFFHFALKKNGILLLGGAETPGNLSNYFKTINANLRFYQKIDDVRIPISTVGTTRRERLRSYEPKTVPQFIEQINKRKNNRLRQLGLKSLIDSYMPPTFICNARLKLVYTYGDTSMFINKPSPGEVSNEIVDMVVPELTSHVLSAAHEVIREDNSILYENVFAHTEGDSITHYDLKAFSFLEENVDTKYVAISLLKQNSRALLETDKVYTPNEQTEQRLNELDKSLIECQRMYREVLEDLDTTSEELQSSNEELMAANEELQSTNEELQSVNEELYTVNSEYQQKIIQLTDINNDLENLLTVTDFGVLFLDEDLRIRRYTEALTKFINIMEFDISRPFNDLSINVKFDNLYQEIQNVNDNGTGFHKIIDDGDEKIEISITPYSIGKKNTGVVLSMRCINKELYGY